MSDASRRSYRHFGFGHRHPRRRPPAKALECRGGFGGVQGWGGLYRDNRDVGSFPIYIAYGDGVVVDGAFRAAIAKSIAKSIAMACAIARSPIVARLGFRPAIASASNGPTDPEPGSSLRAKRSNPPWPQPQNRKPWIASLRSQ